MGKVNVVLDVPITIQPGNVHHDNLECPPGLSYLRTVDQLFVKQKVEGLEVFTGFESLNRYEVKNGQGQRLYYALEDSDCCERTCSGSSRSFNMKFHDNFNNEVITLFREFACTGGCCPYSAQQLEVYSPPGHLIGIIGGEGGFFSPKFTIMSSNGEPLLRIEGPASRLISADFNIYRMNGEHIGKIAKQWSGLAREIFTDADFFGIEFPIDLEVQLKAVLLGACMLIDFVFYEE